MSIESSRTVSVETSARPEARLRTVAIIQPCFLPWRGYFRTIARADAFVFYDDVAYDKHGWRNRNQVQTPNGVTWITVPVQTKGRSGQLVRDAEIDHTQNWRKKILGTIRSGYRSTRYFNEFFPVLEAAIEKDWATISDLDIYLTIKIADYLGIKTQLTLSSDLKVSRELPRVERLVEICRVLGAERYLSGPTTREYIGEDPSFRNAGIKLEYMDYGDLAVYPQAGPEFQPYLSAVDLIFNCGPEAKFFL